MPDNSLQIFSVFHKAYPLPPKGFITPIQVGNLEGRQDLGYLSDASGKNIAHKNSTHCELTALYWIWKHLWRINSTHVGLCHYRRYFITDPEESLTPEGAPNLPDVYKVPPDEQNLALVGSAQLQQELLSMLEHSDVLVPRPISLMRLHSFPISLRDHYFFHHCPEDWNVMERVLQQMDPVMGAAFKDFSRQTLHLHGYNMLVCSKAILSAYCEWLFPILDAVEKQIKLSDYAYQRRVFGFLSERLLNFYLHYKQLKIKEVPVMFFTH